MKDKKYRKFRDHCHCTEKYGRAVHSSFVIYVFKIIYDNIFFEIGNLKYKVPKKIPIVFHNRSDYDYHFIKKELAEEFKKQFTCLGENTEKYITLQFQ